MPDEFHHMATWYGEWAAQFQQIADKCGLSVRHTARAWSVFEMPHKGPHPWNYHNWVYEQMQDADGVAQSTPEDLRTQTFIAEFRQRVVDVVLDDPTVVRAAYWACRDKWR